MAIKCSTEYVGYEYRIQEDFGSNGQRTLYGPSFERQKMRQFFKQLKHDQSRGRRFLFQVRPINAWDTIERS